MSGVSPKLPLHANDIDGHYALNKTFKEATKQNLKNLVLTVPGERIMNPNFGAGIYEVLFEQDSPWIVAELASRIEEQVAIYLPHVEILDVQANTRSTSNNPTAIGPNTMSVSIKYRITVINDSDQLDITFE